MTFQFVTWNPVGADGGVSAAAGRGPYDGGAWPSSNAPRSGAEPMKPSLMFGRIAPASTAPQPAVNVICCGGIGTGAGPGTSNDTKQVVRLISLPFVSKPDAAANA